MASYGKKMVEASLRAIRRPTSSAFVPQARTPNWSLKCPGSQVTSQEKVETWLKEMNDDDLSLDLKNETDLSTEDEYVPESEAESERDSLPRSILYPALHDGGNNKEVNMEDTADVQGPSQSQLRKAFERVTVAGDPKINGSRNYRKPDYCLFCKGRYSSKISAHFLSVHSAENRVQQISSLPTGSKERKRLLTLLQNEGNHIHNTEVLRHGNGEITVCRRPTNKNEARPECYLPCTECFAWVFEKSLALHSRSCPGGKIFDKNFIRNSKALLVPFINLESNEAEIYEVFDHMKETKKYPGLRDISQKDELIREFCKGLLHKLGTQEEQRRKDKDNIRTKIRTVARLLNALNEDEGEINPNPLEHFLKPKYFMLVVNTVKKMALSANSPNLALTIGHYIKQLCQLKRSLALRNEDDIRRKEADDFDHLYAAHWNCYVSAVALRRLRLRTLNKAVELPKTSDLVSLKNFVDEKIKNSLHQRKFTLPEWTDIAQIVMVRIILFNKRRISEVEELKVSEFEERSKSTENDEILSQLDMTEKLLAKRMSVVEVRGKSTRGIRKVFIILSESMVKICRHLTETRLYAGISPCNPFMFARKETGPLDGCTAMRIVSQQCPSVENPHLIRTRLLRKYLATTAQILDMTGGELKMVADHMGHSIAVHTDIYRLQSSLLEKTKVARALIALENGMLGKFSGRNLAACTLEDIPIVTEMEEDEEEIEAEEIETLPMQTSVDGIRPNNEASDDHDDQASSPSQRDFSGKQRGQKRKRWDRDEEEALFKAFRNCISEKKNATASQIQEAQKQYPSLINRSVATIRTKVNNILLGKCKNISQK